MIGLPHRLHEPRVESLVVIFEVNPPAHSPHWILRSKKTNISFSCPFYPKPRTISAFNHEGRNPEQQESRNYNFLQESQTTKCYMLVNNIIKSKQSNKRQGFRVLAFYFISFRGDCMLQRWETLIFSLIMFETVSSLCMLTSHSPEYLMTIFLHWLLYSAMPILATSSGPLIPKVLSISYSYKNTQDIGHLNK